MAFRNIGQIIPKQKKSKNLAEKLRLSKVEKYFKSVVSNCFTRKVENDTTLQIE